MYKYLISIVVAFTLIIGFSGAALITPSHVFFTDKLGSTINDYGSVLYCGSGGLGCMDDVGTPLGIAYDSTNAYVYWVDTAGKIKKAPSAGGGTITTVVSSAGDPKYLALDVSGNKLYW